MNTYVDIVFANEEEAKAYTGREPEAALNELAAQCSLAVVKIGKAGSLVKAGDELVRVAAIPVHAIDTTGAGDVYASGFLYGLANGFSLANCGKLGGLLAAEVIRVLGAKIPDEAWPKIFSEVEAMK